MVSLDNYDKLQLQNTLMTSNFVKLLNKLWYKLSQLDEIIEQKYTVPQFSKAMKELAEFIKGKHHKRHKSNIRKANNNNPFEPLVSYFTKLNFNCFYIYSCLVKRMFISTVK